jgi:hypothetical protein
VDRKAELYYLDKDKLIEMKIVSRKNSHHISVYNDKTNKSVSYKTNNKDLKGLLADLIYKYLETN